MHIPRRLLPLAARPSSRAQALLALVVAATLWGTSTVASKAALEHLPPLTLAALRFAVALLVLLPLLSRAGARPATGRTPALLGLTGVFLVYLCQNVGLRFSSAANATLIIEGGLPVLTALLAAVVLGERVAGRRGLGIGLSLAGVAVITLVGSGGTLGVAALGDLLLLGSAASFAAYSVIGRRAFAGGLSLPILAGGMRYGLLFLLPATAVELAAVPPGPIGVPDLLLVLYLGVGCSALTYGLWGYGLARVEASQAAAVGNLMPVVGVAGAALVLGEPLSVGQLGGGALVLGGVWLATSQSGSMEAGVRRLAAAIGGRRRVGAAGWSTYRVRPSGEER